MGVTIINQSKSELKTLITNSSLSDEQKQLWDDVINISIESDVASMPSVIREDEAMLSFLTENLQEKLDVLKSGDKKMWEDIMKKEQEFIEAQ